MYDWKNIPLEVVQSLWLDMMSVQGQVCVDFGWDYVCVRIFEEKDVSDEC